ncbi:hypothetical protein PENTCL1PPCAC_28664, partial [Pristionchus entomophagus]
ATTTFHAMISLLRLLSIALLAMVASGKPVKDQYELETAIQDDINVHRVMIYSKTYCPYSRRLKSLLTKYDIDDMKVIELNKEDQMSEMQDFLETLSGRRTVPQLFLNGQFVGGYDDVKALEDDGEFEKRLMQAGAIPWRV